MSETPFIITSNYPEQTTTFTFPNKTTQQLNSLIAQEAQSLAKTGAFVVTDLIKKVKQTKTEFDFSNNSDKSQLAFLKERIKNITFLKTNYINEFGVVSTTPEISLELCLIDLDFTNNEVETQIMNQKGTVKEITSQGDSQIQISGAIIGNYTAPTPGNSLSGKDQTTIRSLIELANAKVSINIASEYLSMGGIKKILIKNLSLPQQSNFWNIQNFTLNCVSDDDNNYIL